MSFAVNTDPRYFSLPAYRALVDRAIAQEYRIVPFREFAPPEATPVLLLRHDLDGPLEGARAMAEIEAEARVRATYFVQTAGEFYNLLAPASRALLRRLVELGHEIGLHYEARRYAGPGGARALTSDLRLLEDLTGERIRSASQHIPIDDVALALDAHVENEASAARFTQAPMTYISDSLMAWRQATPHDLLDRRASFQLLTHPETWASGYRDMGEALADMMAEEIAAVRARYAATEAHYRELYAQRDARDARYRELRERPVQRIEPS